MNKQSSVLICTIVGLYKLDLQTTGGRGDGKGGLECNSGLNLLSHHILSAFPSRSSGLETVDKLTDHRTHV